MNIKYFVRSIIPTIVALLFLAGCNSGGDDFDYGKEVILVTGTESNPLVKFVVEDTPASYVVTASSTGKVSEDVNVEFALDTSLVSSYNETHNTSFYAIPASAIEIEGENAVIEAGSASSSGVTVRVVSTEDFLPGRSYIIPVTIKGVNGGNMDVLAASNTVYLRIARVISFNSLDLSNPNMYSSYIAPDDKVIDLPNFSYEIKCYMNSWGSPIARLCNFGPKDESITNLLRFGENGQDINSLQWVSPGGSIISSTRFNLNQWYTITLTFDGSNYIMYVNGVKDAELAGTTATEFQRLELGMSWTGYPSIQRFNGRVAEIRLWNRPLSSSEIQIGLCGVDPTSEGLVAYWKLNEGEGHIFRDATGNGYNMDWSSVWREISSGAGLSEEDKSNEVNWIFDDNNKCNQ
nr:DUF1735 and LamG domain-containing protein [uncultured Draconibacterium sp.]